MSLPSELTIQTPNIYRVVHQPRHSGLSYELWELYAADGRFHRHLTELEVALLRAGFEAGKKGNQNG